MLAFFLAAAIAVPSPTLLGRIVEEQTGRPLRDCDVTLEGLSRLAGTDSLGMFALPDPRASTT